MTLEIVPTEEEVLDRTGYDHLPPVVLDSLDLYLRGYPPGPFLLAVLANDLAGAVRYGDPRNLDALVEIVKFVYNRLPSNAWGSRAKVELWLARHQ